LMEGWSLSTSYFFYLSLYACFRYTWLGQYIPLPLLKSGTIQSSLYGSPTSDSGNALPLSSRHWRICLRQFMHAYMNLAEVNRAVMTIVCIWACDIIIWYG